MTPSSTLSTAPAPNSESARVRYEREVADELARRDELAERLRWLVKLRWVAVCGVGAAIWIAATWGFITTTRPLVVVAAAMVLLNLGFHSLHLRMPARTLRALGSEALLQIASDVAGLGLLLLFSGGLSNPFIFFFTFHVVISAILLEKKQAYGVALLTICAVLALALADALQLTDRWVAETAFSQLDGSPVGRYSLVFALSVTMLILSFLVSAIVEHLRASSHDVRRLNADLNERVVLLASAERKLAAEHQRARAILECMEEGVVVVDLHGKVLLANTAAQKSALLALTDTLQQAGCHDHGGPQEEGCLGPLAGESLLAHRHPEKLPPEAGQPIDAAARAQDQCPMGTPAACLQEALSKGGNLCPATLALLSGASVAPTQATVPVLVAPKSPTLAQVELHGRRFENTVSAVTAANHETVGLVIVSRDVTDRHNLERQVVHAEKLHALGNLAAGLAHELSTPLGTILGYAQMLLDDQNGDDSAPPIPSASVSVRQDAGGPRKEVRIIEEQARRCRKIVQGLLDFARKSGGGREECAPNELALRVRDLIAHSLELRGIELKLDLCEPPPPKTYLAVNEVEQVLVNLVTNAADAIESHACAEALMAGAATPGANQTASGGRNGDSGNHRRKIALAADGSGPASVTIQTRAEPGGKILFAVEDNGPGVGQELAGQIFEPFFTTKAAGKGTGLGLSIARRIVEDHQGVLQLKPRTDGRTGCRFEVLLDVRTAGFRL